MLRDADPEAFLTPLQAWSAVFADMPGGQPPKLVASQLSTLLKAEEAQFIEVFVLESCRQLMRLECCLTHV